MFTCSLHIYWRCKRYWKHITCLHKLTQYSVCNLIFSSLKPVSVDIRLIKNELYGFQYWNKGFFNNTVSSWIWRSLKLCRALNYVAWKLLKWELSAIFRSIEMQIYIVPKKLAKYTLIWIVTVDKWFYRITWNWLLMLKLVCDLFWTASNLLHRSNDARRQSIASWYVAFSRTEFCKSFRCEIQQC